MLGEYDIQVIFYHPPHSLNGKFSLPNKFFESIRAGLAVIVGDSPSMKELVQKYEAGWVAPGWSHLDLAQTILKISRESLVKRKKKAIFLAKSLSPASQKSKFLRALKLGE
jgi:glycosyltransferase involved in cell wall biosynthesis